MNRLSQLTFLASALVASWLGMQAIHELGHVLAAWATGGTVQQVVFHPLTISRTDVAPKPSPLVVAWAGPLVGAGLPLALAAAAKGMSLSGQRYFDIFAGFCLIANGAYIGIGAIDGIGDAGELLRHGSHVGGLVAFGGIAILSGLWIWHRTSGEFGFGASPRNISARQACFSLTIAVAVTAAAAIFGHR
jgi:hypothetical protein